MKCTYYDKLGINTNILLDLQFREGGEDKVNDNAKPHHKVSLINAPTWTNIASGLNVLEFNGANEYMECLVNDSLDLDFMATDYSIAGWFNWTAGAISQIIIGRYEVDVAGWELYLTDTGGGAYHLTLRHHHAGTLVDGNPRSAYDSLGWTPGVWTHFAVVRVGNLQTHYRNSAPVTTTYSTGGVVDPETCAQDMVFGTRFTKNTNWYGGQMARLKVWNRALTASEVIKDYNSYRSWFP